MSNYVVIIIGWLLGQAAYACKKSWDLQIRNIDLSFKEALKMHFTKETAAFAFGTVFLLIGIFISADYVNLDISKAELKNLEAVKWKIYLVNFLRTASVLFGYLCQSLGYFIFGRSEKILKQRAEAEGINLPKSST